MSPPPGPSPSDAGREAERQAEHERDRAGPQARGRLDPLTGRERNARADHEQRAADRRLAPTRNRKHVRHALADRAAAGPQQEAEQQAACDEAQPDRVDGGLVQLGQAHAREVRAPHARPRARLCDAGATLPPARAGAWRVLLCGGRRAVLLAMAARPRVRPAAIQFDAAGGAPALRDDRRSGISLRAVDTAVVTGAGRGIGREIARLLAARGYAVLVTDVNEDAARETAELLGEHAWPMAQDVRDPTATARSPRPPPSAAR